MVSGLLFFMTKIGTASGSAAYSGRLLSCGGETYTGGKCKVSLQPLLIFFTLRDIHKIRKFLIFN